MNKPNLDIEKKKKKLKSSDVKTFERGKKIRKFTGIIA